MANHVRDDGLVDELSPEGINPFDPFISEEEEEMAIRAGQFRTEVIIQVQATGKDAWGEKSTAGWSTVATVWASVVPVRGAERVAADQKEGVLTHKVNMRYRSDVSPLNRITFDGGRVLDIEAVANVGNRGAELEIQCLERSIGALGVGVQLEASIDTKALDFATNETLLNSSDNPIGIGNEWSIQINTKPLSATINMFILRIQPVAGNANQIVINLKGSSANDPIRMQILRTSGAVFKDYDWNNTFTSGTKVSYVFTWDGTSLLLYVDGVLTEADTKTSDYTASMSATDRRVSVGSTMGGVSYTGTIHSVSVWDVVLTQAEVSALQNGGSPQSFDNRFDSGGYASKDNLQHYWRCGFDATDIGRDYG
ncbi:hypothetical protein LCGC14_2067810, partial [marine sediment metagenome]